MSQRKWVCRFVSLALLTLIISSPRVWADCISETLPPLCPGDLVFIESTSTQSEMLRVATQSKWTHVGMLMLNAKREWTVAEASMKVTETLLREFIRKGVRHHFSIRRLRKSACKTGYNQEATVPPESARLNSQIRTQFERYRNKSYDLWFKLYQEPAAAKMAETTVVSPRLPEDKFIYCSELTYRIGRTVFGVSIGTEQTFSELLGVKSLEELERAKGKSSVLNTMRARFKDPRQFNFEAPVVTPISQFESSEVADVLTCEKPL